MRRQKCLLVCVAKHRVVDLCCAAQKYSGAQADRSRSRLGDRLQVRSEESASLSSGASGNGSIQVRPAYGNRATHELAQQVRRSLVVNQLYARFT